MPKQKLWIILGAVVVVALIALVALNGAAPQTSSAATVQTISPQDYQSRFAADTPHFLLDVRTPEEFATGYITGATNISVQTLADRLSEVPKDTPVVVYCRSGNRSAQAARILSDAGYSEIYDLGGVNSWTAAGLPLQ
ncbi:MAG: rhodanese-like domain-containing protein [Anaerolineae bacterium]|nr:rhodanese-like domain-containing protein [Anaerolineae bacterium]